jgi:hypothetical protein
MSTLSSPYVRPAARFCTGSVFPVQARHLTVRAQRAGARQAQAVQIVRCGELAWLRSDQSKSATAAGPPPCTRWASAASMNGVIVPSSTSAGLVLTTPVRRSFTIW